VGGEKLSSPDQSEDPDKVSQRILPLLGEYAKKLYSLGDRVRQLRDSLLRRERGTSTAEREAAKQDYLASRDNILRLLKPANDLVREASQFVNHGRIGHSVLLELSLRPADFDAAFQDCKKLLSLNEDGPAELGGHLPQWLEDATRRRSPGSLTLTPRQLVGLLVALALACYLFISAVLAYSCLNLLVKTQTSKENHLSIDDTPRVIDWDADVTVTLKNGLPPVVGRFRSSSASYMILQTPERKQVLIPRENIAFVLRNDN
jgi:hypothetical protein